MQVIRHILVILAALFVLLGLPAMYFTQGATGETDSVSGASQAVPERPSGEFVVLMSKERHPDSLDAWTDFFSERPTDVIMEDLSCMTVQDDTAGLQLARRYQSRLSVKRIPSLLLPGQKTVYLTPLSSPKRRRTRISSAICITIARSP